MNHLAYSLSRAMNDMQSMLMEVLYKEVTIIFTYDVELIYREVQVVVQGRDNSGKQFGIESQDYKLTNDDILDINHFLK